MTVYQDTQRTLAIVFASIAVLLICAACAIGGDAWPGVCWTRTLTGAPCADCGLVRGILYACAGEFAAASRAHASAPFVAAWLAVQAPTRFLLARRPLRGASAVVFGAVDLLACVGALELMR